MSTTSIRFTSFPRTRSTPTFVPGIVGVFLKHESSISTIALSKGLESDEVLSILSPELLAIGFEVELGKGNRQKIARPVFFGENGIPSLRYEIDAYMPSNRCGLEVEAGRSTMGNSIFRNLFQAMVMVDVDYLCLAIPNAYKYKSSGKQQISKDYDKTIAVADALFGHSRVAMPYGLTVIGY